MSKSRKLTPELENIVFACPNCDSAGELQIRDGKQSTAGNPKHDLYCIKCQTSTEKVVVRPKQKGGKNTKYVDFTPQYVDVEKHND